MKTFSTISSLGLAVLLSLAGCSAGSMSENGYDPGNTAPDDPMPPGEAAQHGGAKVRSFFPETLLSAPFVETDAQGRLSMDIELADSITTWRATAVANSLDGKVGAASFGIRVFQPFFVDLDLPVEVTRGDVLDVPIVVYNFDSGPLTVRLDLEAGDGLAIVGSAGISVDVEAGRVKSVTVPVEALTVGRHELTVNASSGSLSDAVRRTLKVAPDGKRTEVVESGLLSASTTVAVEIPDDIVEGSARLLVKLYPGKASLDSESAASLLNQPSGCFEQTTASSWPNVMVLALLQDDPNADPEVEAKARALVSDGYQRILTFQDPEGGFSWWGGGDAPGLAVTALGLMQLVDTSRVHPVDEGAIERAARWLAGRQATDGSFEPDTHLHCGNMSVGESKLRMTAYVAWALAHAGLEEASVGRAVEYLRGNAADIEDVYTLSLAVMALDTAGVEDELRDTLAGRLREKQAGDGSIASDLPTMYYAYGDQGTAENTALGGLAFLAGGAFTPAADAAGWITENRQGSWGYGNTQTTVQSLRLLGTIQLGPAVEGDLTVAVRFDGAPFAQEVITQENADVVRQFDLSNLLAPGSHTLELDAGVDTSMHYEAITVYHRPWSVVGEPASHLSLTVGYDRTNLLVGETATVTATIGSERDEDMPLAELGIPPGFILDPDGLEAAKLDGTISRFEVKNGRVVLYLDAVLAGTPVTVSYQLKAGMAVEGTAPSSAVYPYYNPALRTETSSFPVTVVAP
jgi:uncharacterized protein YfaS (alpha-2-macroglobulin family)